MMAGRGVVAALFGVAIALWRVPVFDAVVVSFSTYGIADGLLAIASRLTYGQPGWNESRPHSVMNVAERLP
jgi:tetrahydromethanopterin S-methyltransferase subunit C